MPAGRPKKTLDDLPEGWRDRWIALAKEGASELECRVDALGGIAHETFTRMCEDHPEFLETRKICRDLCALWWERAGRQGMFMGGKDNPWNATTWIFNMKNRFNWADKSEVKQENTGNEKQEINVNIHKNAE